MVFARGPKPKTRTPLPQPEVRGCRTIALRASALSPDLFRAEGETQFDFCEGKWHQWVHLARMILASPNTLELCPDDYQPLTVEET